MGISLGGVGGCGGCGVKRRVTLTSIVAEQLISAWDNRTNGEGKS